MLEEAGLELWADFPPQRFHSQGPKFLQSEGFSCKLSGKYLPTTDTDEDSANCWELKEDKKVKS